MVKKAKDHAGSVANRDIIQRLNFLYQASAYMDSLDDTSGPHTSAKDLSRTYIRSMKVVGKKTTVKMDPSVKRTLCRGCDVVLVPGTTASVRVKPSSSHRHAVAYTCLACKTSRRIPAPPTLHLDPEDPPHEPVTVPPQTNNKRQRKKAPVPHMPPLFAHPVGHVVFRGNEKMEQDESGGTLVV